VINYVAYDGHWEFVKCHIVVDKSFVAGCRCVRRGVMSECWACDLIIEVCVFVPEGLDDLIGREF